MKFVYGDRIGAQAKLTACCSAVIFEPDTRRLLLTRRSDNGRWCMPGGAMDAGESIAEACVRETLEETGLSVRVERLIGVYTSPHCVVEYADGNRIQSVIFCFETVVIGGKFRANPEVTDIGYFSADERNNMDLLEFDLDQIRDALENQAAAFIR